jgi:hypothetical protein
MTLAIGLVLALASAGLLNVSFFLQHRASNDLPHLSLRHPFGSLSTLALNPAWLLAFGGGWLGWGLYIAALRLAPLSVVQAISSGGLALLALLAHHFGAGVSTRERVAALLGAVGLVLVCTSLGVRPTSGKAHLDLVVLVVIAGAGLAGALAGPGRRLFQPGAALGTAAGLCYAMGDIATKGAVNGTGLVLVPIFLFLSVLGFVALQLAFQRGGVLQTAGLSALITAVVPIAAGIALYHERIPSGPPGWARGAGFVFSATAALVLGAARA